MQKKLMRFEVPRVSVDFMADELTGAHKLTVLEYLTLDDVIKGLGMQRFGRRTTDNIPLKPVRDWVTEHWDEEFVYDLGKRSVPISFRASLASALFSTRITEYLTEIGEVEVYVTRDVAQICEMHGIPVKQGLTTIDYASLSPETKRELVMPIIDNLYQAEAVARAGLLFPEGVDRVAVLASEPALFFSLMDTDDKKVHFDRIRNLDVQASAAFACIKDYQRIKSLETLVSKPKKEKAYTSRDCSKPEEPEEKRIAPDVQYDKGTTLFDVFPFKAGETKEDLKRAYRRLTGEGGVYFGQVNKRSYEHFTVILLEDGTLQGRYSHGDNFGRSFEEEGFVEFDILSGRYDPENLDNFYDQFRCKAAYDLVSELREELEANNQAIQQAKSQYDGQTSFTVEKPFLEALTSRRRKEATKAEVDEDRRLAREAEETAGIYGKLGRDDDTMKALTIYHEAPVDKRTLELDYEILRAIKEQYHFDMSDMFAVTGRLNRDNIGDWFSSMASMLAKFESVLVDVSEFFSVLGIPPTNEEQEVKKAYRAIAIQFHPDKTSGLPLNERLEVTHRFMKAVVAYRNVMDRLGTYNTDALAPTYYLGRISELFNANN